MTQKLATIGWQGITVRVPEDWSLVGIPALGDDRKGHLRIDSPVASGVQIRWEPVHGNAPDLEARTKEFLANSEKTSRKAKQKFTSKVKPDADRKHSVSFSWNSEQSAQGRLIYCEKCDRVVIAQVVMSKEENISRLAPIILDSLQDHREDGWVDWAMYGLEFAVPEKYALEEQKLMSGYLSLTFKCGPKRLVVQRWGLANTLMGDAELKEWYRKDVLPDIKGYRVEMRKGEISGHEALVIEGKRSGIKQAAKALAHSLTLHPHPDTITGYAWHCPESNRLFSVRAMHTRGEEIAEKVRDLITCHGK